MLEFTILDIPYIISFPLPPSILLSCSLFLPLSLSLLYGMTRSQQQSHVQGGSTGWHTRCLRRGTVGPSDRTIHYEWLVCINCN